MEETAIPLETPKKRSHLGTILGTIVMIGVLLLGGLYIWGAKIEKERQQKVEETLRMMGAKEIPSPTPMPVVTPDGASSTVATSTVIVPNTATGTTQTN